uniref:Uncharacterized protein n=1 Tax=viral metagenome TaxID=1070528 RepID=A0A6C0H6R4_9ZZZZ
MKLFAQLKIGNKTISRGLESDECTGLNCGNNFRFKYLEDKLSLF